MADLQETAGKVQTVPKQTKRKQRDILKMGCDNVIEKKNKLEEVKEMCAKWLFATGKTVFTQRHSHKA